MSDWLFVLAGVAWLAVGFAGAVYAWTRTLDLQTDDAVICAFASICGPFTWLLHPLWKWEDRTADKSPRVLIRRRDP